MVQPLQPVAHESSTRNDTPSIMIGDNPALSSSSSPTHLPILPQIVEGEERIPLDDGNEDSTRSLISHRRVSVPSPSSSNADAAPQGQALQGGVLCGRLLAGSTRRHLMGTALIVMTAGIWVVASECIQRIFGEFDFDAPFFITYVNTLSFILWNVCFLFRKDWRRVFTAHEAGYESAAVDATVSYPPENPVINDDVTNSRRSAAAPTRLYSGAYIFRVASGFAFLWMLSNTLFNFSLARTKVSSNTILSSTSCVWTVLLQYLLFRPKRSVLAAATSRGDDAPAGAAVSSGITRWTLLALVCCVGGSVCVALDDTSKDGNGKDSLVGDALALAAAVGYACYTTYLKYFLSDETRYSMAMVFAFFGLVSAVGGIPVFAVLHVTGIEPFQLPTGRRVVPALILNALIGTNISDLLWAKGVVLTSPAVATLGLSLTIPLSMGLDALLGTLTTITPQYGMGAALVLVGFFVSNVNVFFPTSKTRDKGHQERQHDLY